MLPHVPLLTPQGVVAKEQLALGTKEVAADGGRSGGEGEAGKRVSEAEPRAAAAASESLNSDEEEEEVRRKFAILGFRVWD